MIKINKWLNCWRIVIRVVGKCCACGVGTYINICIIEAIIYCEAESHKGIIIGKKGAMLKKVSSKAREDMEQFFECKVNLSCWVKVKEDWRNRQGLIHTFGLD